VAPRHVDVARQQDTRLLADIFLIDNELAKLETTYNDYKSFEGVMLPTHFVVSQGGMTALDVSVLKVEFPSKPDARMFDKPKDE